MRIIVETSKYCILGIRLIEIERSDPCLAFSPGTHWLAIHYETTILAKFMGLCADCGTRQYNRRSVELNPRE